jgi:hypothetical protein
MKRLSMFFMLIVNVLMVFAQNPGKQKFYVGTFTSEGA